MLFLRRVEKNIQINVEIIYISLTDSVLSIDSNNSLLQFVILRIVLN